MTAKCEAMLQLMSDDLGRLIEAYTEALAACITLTLPPLISKYNQHTTNH